MKITLNVDDAKVQEAMAAYGISTKTELIDYALAELLRKKRLRELMAMQGEFPEVMDNESLEKSEKQHYGKKSRR